MPGRIVKTVDSAFATFLYDTRMGKEGWNKGLLKMYKVDPKHMPEIIDCTDLAGGLTAKAADDLHPPPGCMATAVRLKIPAWEGCFSTSG